MIKTLYAYEEEFKYNNYYGEADSAEYIIKEGKNNILVSSPHCFKHYREGNIKVNEILTGAIGNYLNVEGGCHFSYVSKFLEKDANWDDESDYRNAMKDYIINNNISYLIDLHGTKEKNYDLIIGINDMKNINNSIEFYNIIKTFWINTNFNVAFDYNFKASRINNICKSMNESTKVYAMQFEISDNIRFNEVSIICFLDKLLTFTDLLSRLKVFQSIEICKKYSSSWPLNYCLISSKFAKKLGLVEGDVLNYRYFEYENGSDLNIVIDRNIDDEKLYVSGKSYNKIQKYNNNMFLSVIKKYNIDRILKSKISDVDDNTITINKELYDIFKSKGYKYVKVYNPFLNISSIFKYIQHKETNNKKNTIWINYKNRNLLGIELKISYTLHEYERIYKLLCGIDFTVNHCNKKYLIKFFEECFYLEGNNKYQQYTNIKEKIKEVYTENELNDYKLNNLTRQELINKIKKDYSNIFKLYIVGTSINGFSKKNYTSDILVGYSNGKVLTSRINDYLEGTNNVKINEMTASLFDIQLNERIIIYNGSKKLSCRVIIDENVSDMELQISKSIRSKLNISYENSVINVKRDNTHIILKKLDSMIITISLTSITIVSFFREMNFESKILQLFLIILIIILTISSTFSDRRKNVKK